jgi:serine/threonine-protein kinase HipA
MTDRVEALDVWVNQRRVGQIKAVPSSPRSFVFSYSAQAKADEFVSLTMPVREDMFEDGKLFPIFEQNLPEGELKALLGTRYAKSIPLIDDFDYLAVCGLYWKGRVRVSEVDGEPKKFGEPLPLVQLLDEDPRALFEELVEKYGFATATRSGVQPKLALPVSAAGGINPDNRTTMWTEDKIVKFENDDSDYPGIVVNEFVSMTAARESGITVPRFEISHDAKRIVIDRFDQAKSGRDFGFEEAATLMLYHATEKYSSSYDKMCRILLEDISEQHRDEARKSLAKQLLLMTLIGNGDAHLKNFGVLYSGISDVRLAPAYDVVCTTLYIERDLPALGFNGRKVWFAGEKLIKQIAKTTGLEVDLVALYLEEVQRGIARAMNLASKQFNADVHAKLQTEKIVNHWEHRLSQFGTQKAK